MCYFHLKCKFLKKYKLKIYIFQDLNVSKNVQNILYFFGKIGGYIINI